MNNIIEFYSWQSDLSPKTTRNFVERALRKALKEVEGTLNVKLILDQDSRGASGSPNIPETIRSKIRRSAVFVADLSIVAPRKKGGGIPNGCVCVEWGWAEEALGSAALIGAMNTAHGGPESLPVDFRQNLVRVTYVAEDNCEGDALKDLRQRVTKEFAAEIENCVRARFFKGFHPAAPQIVKALMERSLETMTVNEHLKPADIAQIAGVPEDVAKAVMDDMLRTGLAQSSGGAGSGFMIQRTPEFYIHFDPLFMGWNADRDAVDLARALIRRRQTYVANLNDDLGWSRRQMDPAVHRLVSGGFAVTDSGGGALFPNESTEAFAEGRITFDDRGRFTPRPRSVTGR